MVIIKNLPAYDLYMLLANVYYLNHQLILSFIPFGVTIGFINGIVIYDDFNLFFVLIKALVSVIKGGKKTQCETSPHKSR